MHGLSPLQGPIVDYIHLIGYGEFVRSLASSHHISLGRTRFEGEETILNLQTGGNYALHIHLPSVVEFVAATARHLVNARPVNDTSSDDAEDASMLQVPTISMRKNSIERFSAKIFDSNNGDDIAPEEIAYPSPCINGEDSLQPRMYRSVPGGQDIINVMSFRGDSDGPLLLCNLLFSANSRTYKAQNTLQHGLTGKTK